MKSLRRTFFFFSIFCLFAGYTSVLAQAPTVTLTNQKNACDGLSNGSIDVTVTSSANAPFTLFILGPKNFINIPLTTNTPFTASGLPAGFYSVVVQDINGATPDFSGNFTITTLTPDLSLALTAAPPTNPKNNTSCAAPNGAIGIDVSGGSGTYTFLWSGPSAVPANEDQINLAGGTYSVHVTDNNSVCFRDLNSIVITDPSPTAYAVTTTTPSVCLGTSGNVKLANSETGVTYEIYLGGVTGAGTGITLSGNTGTPLNFTIPSATILTSTGSYDFAIRAVNGLCTPVFMNGTATITVNPDNTVTSASSTPTLCVNAALTPITHTTTGATGIGAPLILPPGVTASWASNTITISGTPTAAGTFNYSIPLTGGCGAVNATGTITVTPGNTVTAASSTPTLCINIALTPITHTTTGATGIGAPVNLPAGVTAAWASNTITISGTPTAAGIFNYSIPLTGGCGTVNATGTITVNANNTVTAASSTPTLCINTALTPITHTTTGATGIGAPVNLPAGVTAVWATNTITISGTPTVSGTFNYSIPLTGGCGPVLNATGTIKVTPANTVGAASSTPTICINTALTPITHTTTGATGIGAPVNLPAGVSAVWAANKITISGTPTVAGTFNYSIPLTGGCGAVNATGTITVNPNNTVGAASTTPTLCINTALTPITHATTGATGIGAPVNLPTGVTAVWATNTITISGTPTVSGTFNYSIPLTGGCGPVLHATGIITVTPGNTVTPASSTPTLCINVALTPITHTTAGATGIGAPVNLPAGVTAVWATNTITISGTPTVAGAFNYSIPLTGGCGAVNATGTITVNPDNTVGAASTTPTLCINTALTPITHATTGATGIGAPVNLPAGVTAVWATNTITISGTPTVAGTFNYSIPLTGGCGPVLNATGTITVNPSNTVGAASTTPALCINTALTPITHTTTGATGIGAPVNLPAGVTAAWATNTITISGTPTVAGTFNYSIPLTGGCGAVNATGTITVNPDNTVTAASSTPTLCTNSVLTPITHTTTGATGIGAPVNLPAGVTAVWASNTITISGTPTATGTFNYSIPLTGGCGSVNATGTITVTPGNTVTPASSTPTLCINIALTPITHTTTGATGIGAPVNLPAGVTAVWATNTITISGTPTAAGTFNYSIPLTGGCGTVNATGTITVNPDNTVGAASTTPTLCINTALTPITHATTGATGIGAPVNLPAGVTAVWATNTITISGTPTVAGAFNYSIPLTGGCGPALNATGTITVNPDNTVTAASSTPTLCANSALTPITHTTTGATGIGAPVNLPAGVTAVWATNTITISGTPTASGTFNYSIPLTGGCGSVNATGTITVNPTPTITGNLLLCGTETSQLTGSGTPAVSTPWTSATPSVATVDNTGLVTGITPGTSLITYTDINGCQQSATVTVNSIVASPGPGIDTWVGDVYTDVANVAVPYENGVDYNPSKYRGYLVESEIAALGTSTYNPGTDAFDMNLSTTTALSGANICGSYLDNYSIRFQMKKTLSAGSYIFTLGSDDGVRFYIDGSLVSLSPANSFSTHLYGTYSTSPLCITAGAHDLVIEYFERTGASRVSFQYSSVAVTAAFTSTNTTICSGSSANLQVQFTGTAPWVFTYSDGVTTSSNINSPFNTFSIPVSPTTATTYTLMSVSDANCTGVITGSPVVVSVDTPPDVTLAVTAAVSPLCTGGTTTIDVANSENGVSYQLRNGGVAIGTAVAGNGATINLPTGALASTTTFNVLATRGVCTPVQLNNTATVTVAGSINAALTVTPQVGTLCSGNATNIQVGASENGVNYQLRDNATNANIGIAMPGTGASINLSTGILNSTTTFNVLASNGTCSVQLTSLATVNVDINPNPALAVGALISPLCTGGATSVTVAGSETGVSYQLRDNATNNPIGTAVAGTGATINLPTGPLSATTTFNVLATGGATCSPVQLTNTVTVTVTGAINAGLAVTPQAASVCSGSGTNIQVANSEAGVNYQLRDNATNSTIGGAISGTGASIDLATGALTASTTFNVLADNGTCSIQLTALATVNVDVNPDPGLTTAASIDPVCTGGSSAITVANSEAGVSYQLRDASNANVGTAVAGTGATISLPTGALASTATFNVLASSGTCTSIQLTNTVTVNVGGSLNTSLTITPVPASVCSGSTSIIKIAASEVGVNYQLLDNLNNPVGSPVAGDNSVIGLLTNSLSVTTTFSVLASNGTCSTQMSTTPTVTVTGGPNAGLGVAAQNAAVCSGTATNIQVSNSEVGVSYQLRDNSNNSLIGSAVAGTGATINLPTGNLTISTTFNVFATGGGSCSVQLTSTASVNVLLPTDPLCTGAGGTNCGAFTILATDTRPTCSGQDDGTITINVSGGSPNYIVTLSDPAQSFSQAMTGPGPFTFVNLSPSLTYTYTVKDAVANTCTLPYSLPIQTNVQATASGFVDAKCFNQAVGQATITVSSGGTSPYEYSLDAGTTWTSFTSPVIITNLMPAATPYSILVRDGASDLCPAQVSVTINNAVSDITTSFTATDASCSNNDGTIQVGAVAGGTGPYTYRLDSVDYAALPANNTFTGLAGGLHKFTVIDANGCNKYFRTTINFPGLVNFSTASTDPDCLANGTNGSVVATITSSGTFDVGITTDPINDPTAFQTVVSAGASQATFSGLSQGTYFVVAKPVGALCPSRSLPIIIGGGPVAVDFNLVPEDFICFETKGTVRIAAIKGSTLVPYNYEILSAGSIVQSGTITQLQALPPDTINYTNLDKGNYQMRLYQDQSAASGCASPISSSYKSFTIHGPAASLDTLYVNRKLSLPNIATGSMLIGIQESQEEPYQLMLHLVTPHLQGQKNNYAFDSTWVHVTRNSQNLIMEFNAANIYSGDYVLSIRDTLGCTRTYDLSLNFNEDIYIPNVFTPNNDGKNDTFQILNLPADSKLVITNRWGKEVYHSSDYQNNWNGGAEVDGVYYYNLVAGGKTYTGWVEILHPAY